MLSFHQLFFFTAHWFALDFTGRFLVARYQPIHPSSNLTGRAPDLPHPTVSAIGQTHSLPDIAWRLPANTVIVIIAVIAVVVFQVRRKREKRRRLEEAQAASVASGSPRRSRTKDLEKRSQSPNDVDLERGKVDEEDEDDKEEKEVVETKKVAFRHPSVKRC